MAQATTAADDAAGEDEATHPYVEALTGLPGVEHIAVVDVSGQHVLGEWGGPPGSADPLLARAREAADRTGRRELEDVVSTTPSAYHLSRLVLAGPGHPASVWVGLRVARAQGSLPWSRAALAGLDGPTGAPMLRPRIPAPREPDGPDTAVGGPVVPAPRIVPPPPAPPAAPSHVVGPLPAPPAPAASPAPAAPNTPKVRVALTARIATPTPVVAPDPAPATAETAVADVPVTVEIGLPEPVVPAARSEEPAPASTRHTSFAPVMVVAPPPSPVPEDGSTEEPAPMPYPVIFAPDPADLPLAEDPHDVEEAPDVPGPTEAPADEPDEPDEPRVMRRLIHGLRRRP